MSGLMSLIQTRGDAEVQRTDGGKNKKGQTVEWNEHPQISETEWCSG